MSVSMRHCTGPYKFNKNVRFNEKHLLGIQTFVRNADGNEFRNESAVLKIFANVMFQVWLCRGFPS